MKSLQETIDRYEKDIRSIENRAYERVNHIQSEVNKLKKRLENEPKKYYLVSVDIGNILIIAKNENELNLKIKEAVFFNYKIIKNIEYVL